jgi:hypothetical protein
MRREVENMIWTSANRLSQFCVLCCCLLGWAFAPVSAELSLELDSTRTQYLVDECFYVTTTLTNVGFGDAPLTILLDPEVGVVTLEIVTPDGRTHTYRPRGAAEVGLKGIQDSIMWLAPGGQYTSSVNLTYELTRVAGQTGGMYESDGVPKPLPVPAKARPAPVLSTLGEYSIRVCYAIPQSWPIDPVTLWSNELRVSVAEPTGMDRAAYNVIQTSPYGEDREEPWNAAAEEAEYYAQVIHDYPTSVYATYARWSLGSIFGLAGSHYLRGKPEAPGLIEDSADLFLAVARDAGQGPFGLRATEAAAKGLAKLGRSAQAQALLEDAFTWPTTTDSDRTRLLAWMDQIETGYFQRSAGLGADSAAATQLSLPLRQFAKALSFSVGWVAASNTATVSSPRMKASLRPDEDGMMVNGIRRIGVRTSLKDGRTLVSPSVIATLMAEHWGKGMANAFPPHMVAQVAPER